MKPKADKEQKGPKPSILVVDDDDSFRTSIVEALTSDGYLVHPAANGIEALARLESVPVDLLLTDIRMPGMDGIELVEALLNRKGILPCIVMSAYSTPTLERRASRLGALRVIGKPVDLSVLRAALQDALHQQQEGGVFRGITLASFLQLLALERMTCTVKVSSEEGSAFLFFNDGELCDAATDTKDGLEACFEALSWPSSEIAVHSGCPKSRRTVTKSLEGILLEAAKKQDESTKTGHSTRKEKEESPMKLEALLEDLKGTKGYIASGILNYTGEVLAVHSVSDKVNLDSVAAVFNDVFRGAHEASAKIGLDATRFMTLQTPKGLVLMACSGTTAAAHVHMIAILEESGNQALARMTIDKLLPRAVEQLA
ncbi:MAG: response regulator [Thermoanaerobaculia bacterium]